MRAIASSTACSGLRPSATTRWTALRQTPLLMHLGGAANRRRRAA